MNRNVIRDNYGDTVVLNYEDFLEELDFQLYEDYDTTLEYQQCIIDTNDNALTFEDFIKVKTQNLINNMNNGYSATVMGDTYYFDNI